MKTGILGGSFDPPHNGHAYIACEALKRASLDKVVFMVAARPPHKDPGELAPFEHRLEMARLAFAGAREFDVSGMEAERPGPGYTVDTLREYGKRNPGEELHFIIGSDTLADIPSWREPAEVLKLARFLVFYRRGFPVDALEAVREVAGEAAAEKIRENAFEVEPMDVSSTEVRRLAASGGDYSKLVPAAVRDYVESNGLYG